MAENNTTYWRGVCVSIYVGETLKHRKEEMGFFFRLETVGQTATLFMNLGSVRGEIEQFKFAHVKEDEWVAHPDADRADVEHKRIVTLFTKNAEQGLITTYGMSEVNGQWTTIGIFYKAVPKGMYLQQLNTP